VFAVAEAVLDEGDVDVGEEDQVVVSTDGKGVDVVGVVADISTVPEGCREGGGVAEEDFVGLACGGAWIGLER